MPCTAFGISSVNFTGLLFARWRTAAIAAGWPRWRRRQFQKPAPGCGRSRRPYDLRHSFVSLRIQEGQLTIIEVAEQLGHSVSTTLETSSHVIAEFRGAGAVDADEVIATRAPPRRAVMGSAVDPERTPRTETARPAPTPER